MVALSSSTVTTGSVSMVAWASWVLILTLSLTRAHASTNSKYGGDVSGEEGVIDQLKDYLRSRHPPDHSQDPRPAHTFRHSPQKVNEKIDFAVTPQDPRYYLPARHDPPASGADLLRLMPPDLTQDYPADLLQYQDVEAQYQSEYPAQYRPRYRQGDDYLPDLQYPGAADLYPSRHQDQGDVARLQGKREKDDEIPDEELLMKKDDDNDKDKNSQEKAGGTSQPEAVNYMHLHRSPSDARESSYSIHPQHQPATLSDLYFTALVAGCTAVAVCGVIGAGICWYRLNKSHRAAQDAEYPAYGVTGPNKDLSPSSGDRKLAQSAHMYHYQHQKQQMIALEKSSGGERHGSASDLDSEEEGEDNEYTVYECPGLAPTGEMEVKNPLFQDDPTPASPSVRKEAEEEEEQEQEEKRNK